MTEKQVFGVVIRSCGLLTVIYGLIGKLDRRCQPIRPGCAQVPAL